MKTKGYRLLQKARRLLAPQLPKIREETFEPPLSFRVANQNLYKEVNSCKPMSWS